MVSQEDKKKLEEKGITLEQLKEQLDSLRNGFPFLRLYGPAKIGDGILQPTAMQVEQYVHLWGAYCKEHKLVKFVPASGAASRMFKDLFAFMNGKSAYPSTPFEMTFFNNITKFAFFGALNAVCQQQYDKTVLRLMVEGRYQQIVEALLSADGLNYGALPKGLLLFHKQGRTSRTPVEEHLAEGAKYAKSGDGKVYVHFTVSPEHRALFTELVAQRQADLERRYGVKYDVSFSEQKASTDTIAITPRGDLFRQEDGTLLFRPGGHGSLIENLNDIDADVVFIKNIDNVVPDVLKKQSVEVKKMMGGLLVFLQTRIFEYLHLLDAGNYSRRDLTPIVRFFEERLYVHFPESLLLGDKEELATVLRQKLNRPLRVCAMVRNAGEPGGGPFLVYGDDGIAQLQILESSQIDKSDVEAREMFENGTHFNPVDIVCALKNYKDEPFNLPEYVDKSTGFISQKSKDGRELKALEHPGLWNGAMSNWNTAFVEVPAETFNPVKTVNDLLRPEHLAH